MTRIRMMCVQPIEVDVDHYENLLTRKRHASSLRHLYQQNPFQSEWLQQFCEHHRKFTNYHSLLNGDNQRFDSSLLAQDLIDQNYWVGGEINIAEYLQPELSGYDVVFDPRFFNFVLLYELSFEIPEDKLLQVLKADSSKIKHDDFYNTVRRLLVQETPESRISRWGEKSRAQALKLVEKVAASERKNQRAKVASITCNSGNFTVFAEADAQNQELKQALLECNANAERILGNCTTVVDNEDVHYAFFGRFHTIMAKDKRYYLRYAPIQYHIQFVWYYVRYYSEIMEMLNNAVMAATSHTKLEAKRKVIDEYINKIELLKMHNENIKLALESDNQDVYAKIEGKWNIESSLDNAQSYVSFFKDYLERAYLRKAERANKRQNHILFVISCIQILGLISIWADYLGLSKLEENTFSERINPDMLSIVIQHINTWMPLALFGSLIGLMVFAYMKQE